jgi:LmbE family N-acetylglucosaminyl deacetylase
MAVLIMFHAHPDDETTATAGVMAKYSSEGHRVVLVTATGGEHGEVPNGFLREGETLAQRRLEEARCSASVLGVARVEYLGYVDSGMMGTPENDAPEAFWQADVEEAAQRLATILREEGADVLVHYDENGNYGHPDHIQVHRVGTRAAQLAGTPRVFQATVNRDHLKRLMANGLPMPDDVEQPDPSFIETLGMPEDRLTTGVDVRDFAEKKREAMRCHGSQIADTSFFLQMPDEVFRESFGWEWFIREGVPAGLAEDDLLA